MQVASIRFVWSPESLTKLAIFSTSKTLNRMLPLTGGSTDVNPKEERERSLLQGDSIEAQWEINWWASKI